MEKQAFIYGVHAEFKNGGGVSCAYKNKPSAKRLFDKFVQSGVYDRVRISLQNAVYLPEDEINIAEWKSQKEVTI